MTESNEKRSINIAVFEDNNADYSLIERLISKSFKGNLKTSRYLNYNKISSLDFSSFDIILADLNLTGFQDLKSVKKLILENDNIPVVVLTGNEDSELAFSFVKIGSADFLYKEEALRLRSTLLYRTIVNAIERKKLNQKLKENSLFKSRFLANLSHELRTPLNVISGIAEILANQEVLPETRHYLDLLDSSIDPLLTLVNNVIDISKIESGEMQIDNTNFDPLSSIKKITRLMSVEAMKNNVCLNYQVDGKIPREVITDQAKFEQILINLIGNAIKFSKDGEVKTTYSYSEKTNSIKVKVLDTGIGIAKQNLKSIFEEFKQADLSTTRKYGGTGLGLAITKKIINLFNGEISISSKLGKGTTFTFLIPITLPDEAIFYNYKNQPQPSETKKIKKGQFDLDTKISAKILLAEDFDDNIIVIKAFLKNYDITLNVVKNGKDALKLATTQKYDLILMDTQMPVMDGLTAIQEIRKWEASSQADHKNIIISLTANALREDHEKSISAGANKYLSKPIKQKVLLKEIVDSLPASCLQRNHKAHKKSFADETIQEEFSEYLPTYIINRKKDLDESMKLFDLINEDEKHSLKNLDKICHRILGSARTYGLIYFEKIVLELQIATIQNDKKMIEASLGDIDNYITQAITNLK